MSTFNNLNASSLQKILMQNAPNKLNSGHNGCNLNLDEHFKYADFLVKLGILNQNEAKSIKEKMKEKFALNSPKEGALNPVFQSDFLKTRACLLDYLKNLDTELSERDLSEIEAVVLELEKNALAKRANNEAKDVLSALNSSNELAKERLNCGTLSYSGQTGAPKKTFTRDEISKMSTAEFLKNEPIINYQLENGLL